MVEKFESQTTIKDLVYLPKYPMNYQKTSYIRKELPSIWVNNFELKFTKELLFTEFAVVFEPEIGREHTFLKEEIFRYCDLSEVASEKIYLYTGDSVFVKSDKTKVFNSIYSMEVDFKKNSTKYKITLTNTKRVFDLVSEYKAIFKPVHKMLFELIVNQIIKCNPSIEVFRRMFIKTNDKKQIANRNNVKIDFYPGYTSSINLTKEGIFLTVTTKNRFISQKTCLELIKECESPEEIENKFVGRSVKTTYSKKNYVIDAINSDKNPKNLTFPYAGQENVSLITYYKKAYNIDVTDVKQLLFEVKPRDGSKSIFLVPEFCLLTGIDDSMVKDREFMKNLADYTKLEPKERVDLTSAFSLLFGERQGKILTDKQGKVIKKFPSPFELSKQLGFELQSKEKIIKGYSIKDPLLKSGKMDLAYDKLDRNPVHLNVIANSKKKILIIYHKNNQKDAYTLEDLLGKAGRDYKLSLPAIEWVEINSVKPKDWLETVEDNSPKDFLIVVFVINNRNEYLYNNIKQHSISCKGMGYLSQVVKGESISGKRGMSVASKIICQINNKLGGCQYALKIEGTEYRGTNLMLIGVDSSHISGKRTGVALVATTDKEYIKTISQEDIIEEKNKTQLVFSVGRFINIALKEYFKNTKELPKGIVIYRQGVSNEQKEYLKEEVANIENYCKGLLDDCVNKKFEIPYYYILVNKKNNYKFFQKTGMKYTNPDSGLVIFDGATDGSKFEFFIQPQNVTQGTATPTHYHVAFGTLNLHEIIPKLTYDLCSVYHNWPGPVRVPFTLKLSEKLAKMVSKNIRSELHKDLKNTLCYL